MRKVSYVLLSIAILMGTFSCVEHTGGSGALDKIGIHVSVMIPDAMDTLPDSRAMAEKPDLENLYLAVFDASGYLLEYVKADAQQAVENENFYEYKVALTPTNFATTIHFIGNAPESVSFGTEVEVVASMYSSDGEEAYWQRVQLPNGIKEQEGVLDESVRNALTGVRLIRNFAWIELGIADAAKGNFQLESYCVMNTRTRGSVAPYNTQTKEFVAYESQVTHNNLQVNGYDAFIPEGAELAKIIPDESEWATVVDGKIEPFFIYEREFPRSLPSVILMKGTYDPDPSTPDNELTPRYYKVDLRDNDGNYFQILRNFRYHVEVNSITHEGHSNAQTALEGAGSGDISTSIETEKFSNISNNIARIFVSYTDTTLVTTDKIHLKYKFILFGENSNEVKNNDVTVTLETSEGGDVIKSYVIQDDDDEGEWRTVEIQPNDLGTLRKIQSMVLVGTVTVEGRTYTLQRKVRFTLHNKMNLIMECVPDAIMSQVGQPFDLELKVPGGLGDAMFPMEFELEAEKQSITPNQGDDLPVVTGASIVPGKEGRTTIGFIRTLSWEEYEHAVNDGGYKTVSCHFKSSKASSATKIYARNKFFELAFAELKNYIPSEFHDLAFVPNSVPYGLGQEVAFSFRMEKLPEQGYVTVTLGGLEPAPSETRLKYVGVLDNKAQYHFDPTSLDNTLQLVTQYEDQPVDVKLEAYHFAEANASMAYIPGTFSNLNFNPIRISGISGTAVTFSFDMSKMADNVIVSLSGLEPANNETRLTLIGGNRYSFNPSETSTTLQLITTTGMEGDNPKVTLEALGFETASAEATCILSIPKNNMKVGNNSNISNGGQGSTFNLYSSNPGTLNNPSGYIANFRAKRNASNSNAIELTKEHYRAIVNNGGYVYVRFSSGRNYYVAEVKLDDLLKDGGTTLTFERVY